jgi:hypothetical protein
MGSAVCGVTATSQSSAGWTGWLPWTPEFRLGRHTTAKVPPLIKPPRDAGHERDASGAVHASDLYDEPGSLAPDCGPPFRHDPVARSPMRGGGNARRGADPPPRREKARRPCPMTTRRRRPRSASLVGVPSGHRGIAGPGQDRCADREPPTRAQPPGRSQKTQSERSRRAPPNRRSRHPPPPPPGRHLQHGHSHRQDTHDPNTFTTGTLPALSRCVSSAESSCQGLAGQGWRVRYQVTNDGPGAPGRYSPR